jgi:hypothetical protein
MRVTQLQLDLGESLKLDTHIFINKKAWTKFTDSELEHYIEDVYNYYRDKGFPYYDLTTKEIKTAFNLLSALDSSTLLLEDNKLKQIMTGLNLANHYMPHLYHVKSKKYRSPIDCFNNDTLFRKAIRNVINISDVMSDATIRGAISFTHGTQKVSNFKPSIAKYIYDHYGNNGHVLDYSSGFGGRLLGAMTSNNIRSYTGTDPQKDTYNGLLAMVKDLDAKPHIILHNTPFEDLHLENNFYDLSFSSPPYFNTEEYSYDDTQSFIRHNTATAWRDNWLKVIIEKNYNAIKKGGYFIINVANVRSYKTLEDDAIALSQAAGFTYIKTYKMLLSSLMGSGFKHEPMFVFKKL